MESEIEGQEMTWPTLKPRTGPALLWLAAGAVVGLMLMLPGCTEPPKT